ncbi:hypothetical protein [Chitinophaga deserti]|uniref:hypothetical protein n=1 Tax=Chitinophaga deserti TaxID=2164099 RepID=UPI000D6AC24F|nr:hypothetical protein [Chitinophaga deserti]
MKRMFLTLSVAMLGVLSLPAVAQSGKTGLYLSAEDFAEGKVSYGAAHHKIKADVPFQHGKVKVVNGDKQILLDKNVLYGYRDKHQQDYRFVGNNAYKILDAAGFPIYSREVETSKGKGRIKETKFYFSAQPGSDVMELTIGNLKRAFPDNGKFHQQLDMQFRSNDELARFDEYSKAFTLKTIYNETI